VNRPVPTRAMREHPDIDQLKRQAKELLERYLSGDPQAAAEVGAHYHDADPSTFSLHHAQLVLARSYGFLSWPKLKAYVDGVTAKTFKDAVRKGDLERVRDMLRLRPELVNQKLSGIDDRALHHAVIERQREMVRLLLEHGADALAGMHLASISENYPNALDLAEERGYSEIVTLLRENGQVPPEEKFERPVPDDALFEAFQRGDESAMIACLEQHLEGQPEVINLRAKDGMTVLHGAAAFLLQRVVVWLLDHGADINAAAGHGDTPLDIVGGRGLGKGWSKTGVPEAGETAMMELLLARGAKRTPRWAVATGDAAWLRARHAEGTLGNPIYWHEGLLSLAVRYERPSILTLLLELGFDPDERRRLDLEPAQDSWGQPLRNCAQWAKLEMAEILLAHGADPNGHIYAGGTPLSVAYETKNTTMIELLERHGGYLDAEFVGSLGLMDRARLMLADEAAGCLAPQALAPGAQGEPVAEHLITFGLRSLEMLQLALPRIDRARNDPWWAGKLRQAWGFADLSCLRLVLERCDVQACAPTTLHELAGPWPRSVHYDPEDRLAKATLLLDAGARLNVRDEWSKSTPLGCACRYGRVELVKLFLERGADAVEADAEPWATPRAWAERADREDILALLQSHGG
jgi:ankyrin repeat protein